MSPLAEAYVKLWGAYQRLASNFHDETRRRDERIAELEARVRRPDPSGGRPQ